MSENVLGVDVSLYQGQMDWAKAASKKVLFGAARAVVGWGCTDKWFAHNRETMISNGIMWTAYAVLHPTLDIDKQVDHFLQTVGTNTPDLPLVLDLEYGSWHKSSTLNKSTLVKRVHEWLVKIERNTGRKPLIYTNMNFWNSEMLIRGEPPAWTSQYDLWVANYGVQTPRLPKGWDDWTIWQFSADKNKQGQKYGAESKDVDLNYFNGDEAALRQYAGLEARPTQPASAPVTVELVVPKETNVVVKER